MCISKIKMTKIKFFKAEMIIHPNIYKSYNLHFKFFFFKEKKKKKEETKALRFFF